MTTISPAQQAFGRDMFVDVAHQTDRLQEQYNRKISQIKDNNQRENVHRHEWTYNPDDQVLLLQDAGVQGKMMQLFDGPYRVTAIQEHGTSTLDKGRYLETLSIRRIRPHKPQRGGDGQQPAVTTVCPDLVCGEDCMREF
ncbi:Pol Polyprotein [Phytophthora megakarya]|uniref:Pol Polyprotein n=1 Tax=Phytophthora megakarya TaxID=4795 RepID=A0A225WB85_9STRA|nr:Pol Polyprotein [Phytophthora megakarya]